MRRLHRRGKNFRGHPTFFCSPSDFDVPEQCCPSQFPFILSLSFTFANDHEGQVTIPDKSKIGPVLLQGSRSEVFGGRWGAAGGHRRPHHNREPLA